MKHRLIQTMRYTLFSLVLLLLYNGVSAENIDPDDDNSQYAWGENIGWLNLEPDGDGDLGVQVGEFKLTGYIWGENIGWISLSCENTDTCEENYYEVVNDGNGTLSGHAWGENTGWIDFAASFGGVSIDACGDFNGLAWGENIGWISFDSGVDNPFKATTSWISPIDDIPPLTVPMAPIENWYTDNFTTTFSATDCGSGIHGIFYSIDYEDFVPTFDSSATANITSEGEHSLRYFSVDMDANFETTIAVDIRIDKTPPEISIASPADGELYLLNDILFSDYLVSDAVSGVDTITATVGQGSPISLSATGPHSFTVSATDIAGNSASVTHTYMVAFAGNVDPDQSESQYAYGENIG